MKKNPATNTRTKKVRDSQNLESELTQVKEQAQQYLAGWQRAKADYGNLSKRHEEQRAKLVKTASKDIVLALLPVVDNIERALESAQQEKSDLKQGVELILQQLNGVLAAQGVTRIKAVNKSFNPEEHEAIAKVPGKEGICVIEHTAGYKMHKEVLRPCRVSVGTQQKK